MTVRPIVLIGLGNSLLGDEGIGVSLVQALSAEFAHHSDVECIDLGIAGMALLHILDGRRKVVLLDCALMGEQPGACRRFTPKDVRDISTSSRCSLHDGNLLDLLALAGEIGGLPPEVVIFGIQPESINASLTLSPTLQHKFDEYMTKVRNEVRRTMASTAAANDDLSCEGSDNPMNRNDVTAQPC